MDNPTTEALPALPVVADPPTGWSCSGGQTFLATPGTTTPFTHHTEELWAQENIPKAALALPSRASAALASTTLPGGSVSFGRSPTLQRGRTCPSPPGVHSWKRRSTSSAIMAAMAREEVAAGEGAFLTCRILLPMLPVPPSNTKSSTKFPSLSRA